MRKSHAALLTTAVVLLAGCAGSGPASDEGYTEKYTRTGTHISDRDRMGVQTVNTEDLERQSRAANSGTLVRDPSKGR